MRKALSLLSLAALTVGLLGSCSKTNERIDGLEGRIDRIENDRIASIDQQITAIKESIADLGTIRTNIQTLMDAKEAQGEDITVLKAKDQELEGKINDLKAYVDTELAKYATKDWANATFATLAKQAEIITDVTKLKQDLAGLDAALDQAIEDLDSSLKAWVNEQLSAYSTTAQMEAKIKALQDQIDILKTDIETDKPDIAKLEAGLDQLEQDLAAAKASVKTAYEKAIKDALESNNGYITEKIKKAISSVNGSISSLSGRVRDLEIDVADLRGDVDALKGLIQSVTIIPAYIDGSVEGFGSILKIKCVVEPADAVENITKDNIIVLISEAKTKAVTFDTIAVSKLELDKTTGEINIKADISSITPVPDGKTLMAALEITIGPSNYITGFYPVYSGANVSVTTTEDGSPKIGISSDPDSKDVVSGEIPVEGFYKASKSTTIEVEGFGTITFDEIAAAKIKDNANGATNILIKVEDITKTLANPVPDADVVLEVTMKAVDEAGTEVFSEGKADGVVTLSIPLDDDVVFVKTVTLVNDDGTPIDGGVIPESIVLDLEKHILSFRVKHFSKYAVGYVKSKEFKAVTGVSLNKTSMTLSVDKTETLTATIAPDNATNKNVTWSSSNPAVATVDKDGKVKGISDGTATITVTTEDGNKTATCAVKVTETKTMAELLATNPDIPEVDDMTPPAKAWVNSADTACKAFVGYDGKDVLFTAWKRIQGTVIDEIVNFGLLMTDEFVKTDEDTYTHTEDIVTVIAKMTEGKFTSCEFIFDSSAIQWIIENGLGSAELAEVPILAGTYSAPAKVPNPTETGPEQTVF